MSISLITIDFWNTLVDSSGGEGREAQRAETLIREASELGVEISEESVVTAGKNAWAFFRKQWLDHVRTPLTHEMVDHIWNELGLPNAPEVKSRVEEVYKRGILEHPPALLDGVPDALARLAEKYPLAIVSDTAISNGSVLKEVLDNYGVLRHFTYFSFSDETGVAKPHPKAFSTILDQAQEAPSNALHIGDIERTDIVGARDHGMYAILYAGDHRNSVVKSDVSNSRANAVAHTWQEVEKSLTESHDFTL